MQSLSSQAWKTIKPTPTTSSFPMTSTPDKFCPLWFRLLRRTYPWLPLATTVWRIVFDKSSQRQQEQLRFWMLLVKIDFANLIAMAIDLCQPEYWA